MQIDDVIFAEGKPGQSPAYTQTTRYRSIAADGFRIAPKMRYARLIDRDHTSVFFLRGSVKPCKRISTLF